MKKILLTPLFSLFILNNGFAAATVELRVKKENGELKVVNDRTKTGFVQRGGKNYWTVKYAAEPGTYVMTGKNPGCPVIVQSAAFEEQKSYTITLTKDCRIDTVTF